MMVSNSAAKHVYRMPPYLRPAVYSHAIEAYPEEACGIIVRQPDDTVRYVRSENIAPEGTRDNAFTLDPAVYEPAREDGTLVAVVHSHTKGQAWPSRADMAAQVPTGVPWVIVVLNAPERIIDEFAFPISLDTPLKGIEFRPGVADCMETIRRYYWQEFGVTLPYTPRDNMWWTDDVSEEGEVLQPADDLFLDLFEPHGFRRLAPHEIRTDPDNHRSPLKLQKGDIGICKVMSPVKFNHGVIYTGGQLMMHHLLNRVSAEEPVSRWLPRLEIWLRHRCNELQPTGEETAREDDPPLRSPQG